MKKQQITILLVMAAVCAACKFGSLISGDRDAYSTERFSVKFPGGAEGIETEPKNGGKYVGMGTGHSKFFDNKTPNYRSYEVGEYDLSDLESGMDEKSILKMGLNGWDTEPETVVNEVKINGRNALDSVRTITIGPVSMTFREVVFWSAKDKKMYIVRVSASKKENVSTKEADDFVGSFNLYDRR